MKPSQFNLKDKYSANSNNGFSNHPLNYYEIDFENRDGIV